MSLDPQHAAAHPSLTLIAPPYAVGVAAAVHQFAERFRTDVWPVVSHAFGPGELIQVEDAGHTVAQHLDYLGIDYLFRHDHGETFGISSRIQGCDRQGRPWDSFSLSSDQHGRLRSIATFGRILPAVAIQAFMTTGWSRLVSVGVVRLADLAAMPPTGSHHGPTGPFLSWSFVSLASKGLLVAQYPDPRLAAPFGPTPLGGAS